MIDDLPVDVVCADSESCCGYDCRDCRKDPATARLLDFDGSKPLAQVCLLCCELTFHFFLGGKLCTKPGRVHEELQSATLFRNCWGIDGITLQKRDVSLQVEHVDPILPRVFVDRHHFLVLGILWINRISIVYKITPCRTIQRRHLYL